MERMANSMAAEPSGERWKRLANLHQVFQRGLDQLLRVRIMKVIAERQLLNLTAGE